MQATLATSTMKKSYLSPDRGQLLFDVRCHEKVETVSQKKDQTQT